jgi:molecular chaperone DnaK
MGAAMYAAGETDAAAGAPGAEESASGDEDVVDAEIVDDAAEDTNDRGDSK